MGQWVVIIRSGLRVCPERDEGRLKEAHLTAQAQCFMTLVHLGDTLCHVIFFFGKISRESEPSADFMCVGLFPFFTCLPSLECSYVIL